VPQLRNRRDCHACGVAEHAAKLIPGRFVDLVEVDAGVEYQSDDTRELLDNVQYAPARGRYKVYLIDEVSHAFDHSSTRVEDAGEPPPM